MSTNVSDNELMAVASPVAGTPALVAEEILGTERELRRALPKAPQNIQTLALQAMDGSDALLDPKVIASLSAIDVQKASPEALTLYAAWTKWSEKYLAVLTGLREVAEKSSQVAI